MLALLNSILRTRSDKSSSNALKIHICFIKGIQKVYFFEKPNEIDDATKINNFGLKSVLTPPGNEHLNTHRR